MERSNYLNVEPRAEEAQCSVRANITAVEFKDSETQGRKGMYDGPKIDRELGPATGFIVYAVDKRDGSTLGSASVGPDGYATIKNIKRECNTLGSNSRPALEFYIKTDQSPAHLYLALAEDRNGADIVVGRERKITALLDTTATAPAKPPTATEYKDGWKIAGDNLWLLPAALLVGAGMFALGRLRRPTRGLVAEGNIPAQGGQGS